MYKYIGLTFVIMTSTTKRTSDNQYPDDETPLDISLGADMRRDISIPSFWSTKITKIEETDSNKNSLDTNNCKNSVGLELEDPSGNPTTNPNINGISKLPQSLAKPSKIAGVNSFQSEHKVLLFKEIFEYHFSMRNGVEINTYLAGLINLTEEQKDHVLSIFNILASLGDKTFSKAFFEFKIFYGFLAVHETNFKKKKYKFNESTAITIFGHKVMGLIDQKNYIIKNPWRENSSRVTDFCNERIDTLIKFIASIPNIVEEFAVYFSYLHKKEIVSDEEFLDIVTAEVIKVLERDELEYLKIYLPELYCLEVNLNSIKFDNLHSALAGYIILFYMQLSLENADISEINKEYKYYRSLYRAKKFIFTTAELGCILHVLTLCLRDRDLYFNNYSLVLGELIDTCEKPIKHPKSLKDEFYLFNFFLKNFFFYFKYQVVVKNNFSLRPKNSGEFWIYIFNMFILKVCQEEILTEFRYNLRRLIIKHPYLRKTFYSLLLNLDNIKSLSEMNLVGILTFTLGKNHLFDLSGIRRCALNNLGDRVFSGGNLNEKRERIRV